MLALGKVLQASLGLGGIPNSILYVNLLFFSSVVFTRYASHQAGERTVEAKAEINSEINNVRHLRTTLFRRRQSDMAKEVRTF